MAEKTLTVLGDPRSGKKTLVGCLIYKCGLELQGVEELEREDVRSYSEIVPFFQSRKYTQSFHAPSGRLIIRDLITPDIVFWVIDASCSEATWAFSIEKLLRSLSSGELQPREKILILINKMDLINWSQEVLRKIEEMIQSSCLDFKSVHVVPVSSIRGENIIVPDEELSNFAGGVLYKAGESMMDYLK